MADVFDVYRAIQEQGFLPIFVRNIPEITYDTRVLLDACLESGVRVIEYTLRREDAHEMIPWMCKHYPDLYILAGSTLPNDKIANFCRKKHSQVLTLDELADAGVDGFVSMTGWDAAAIKKFCKSHIVIPSAGTVTEAFGQIADGAHFAKFLGDQIDLVRKCRQAPLFDYCPILVTGGMDLERLSQAVEVGAVLIGSGFDLLLKNRGSTLSSHEVSDVIRQYIHAVKTTRATIFPQLWEAEKLNKQDWLDRLPHYHPF